MNRLRSGERPSSGVSEQMKKLGVEVREIVRLHESFPVVISGCSETSYQLGTVLVSIRNPEAVVGIIQVLQEFAAAPGLALTARRQSLQSVAEFRIARIVFRQCQQGLLPYDFALLIQRQMLEQQCLYLGTIDVAFSQRGKGAGHDRVSGILLHQIEQGAESGFLPAIPEDGDRAIRGNPAS